MSPAGKRKKIQAHAVPRPLQEFLRYLFFFLFIAGLLAAVARLRPAGLAREERRSMEHLSADLRALFPDAENDPALEAFWVGDKKIYPAWKRSGTAAAESSQLSAFAFRLAGRQRFETAELMLGIDIHGRITGIRLVRYTEPFGFSENNTETFLASLRGLSLSELEARPAVDRILLRELVRSGLEFYERNRSRILEEAASVQPVEAA